MGDVLTTPAKRVVRSHVPLAGVVPEKVGDFVQAFHARSGSADSREKLSAGPIA